MLVQLRHGYKNDRSELCAEKEVENDSDFFEFFKETEKTHSLPKRARWILSLPDYEGGGYFKAEDVRPPNEVFIIGETLLKKFKKENLLREKPK